MFKDVTQPCDESIVGTRIKEVEVVHGLGCRFGSGPLARGQAVPGGGKTNLYVNDGRVKRSCARRIFLQSEWFKGILAIPRGRGGAWFPPQAEQGGVSAGRSFALFGPGYSFSAI